MFKLSLKLLTYSLLLVLSTATLASAQPPGSAEILAESGDAYISYDASTQTWEIGTNGISRRMDYDPGNGYRPISLKNKITGREWLAPTTTASSEFQVKVGDELVAGADQAFRVKRHDVQQHSDRSVELVVQLQRGPLVAHLHYVAFPDTNILEQWAVIENTGYETLRDLTALDSAMLTLAPTAEELTLYWVQGLNPQPSDKTPPGQEPKLHLDSTILKEGISQTIGSAERSSEGSMGWFALAAPMAREGLFGGIEWSGAWQLRAARQNGQTTLATGVEGVRYHLAPGESFQAPRRFLGTYRGGLDEAADASHTFARNYILRPRPANFPWAQYNTWFAYYTNLDQELLKREVDSAAALGLEVFVVDAGWYDGSPKQGDFTFGLGSWRENRDKFPSGLAAFSDYVHSRGLKFGLWVEPERVDLRYVGPGKDIAREWLSPFTPAGGPSQPDQVAWSEICLGNPDARTWMKQMLTRVVTDYKVDWLKWDDNAWLPCDPPNTDGNGNYSHVMGLYEVLDYMRQTFPDLVIEDCASGGNRMDYALMRRTDIAWLSDETDPSYRVRYHVFGASYPFPPEYLNSWIVESYWEHFADGEKSPELLSAWMRSRMMGGLGLSVGTLGWSAALRSAVAAEIKEYKDLRPILTQGNQYHLLPQPDLEEPNLPPPTEPDAVEFYDPKSKQGAALLFKGTVPWSQRQVRLSGLDANTTYQVKSLDSKISVQQTGRQLLSQSLQMQLEDAHPSTLLLIAPVR